MMPDFQTPPGAWGVLWLFLIPFGGGIPAGVVFGQSHAIGWPAMEGLYLVSDVILACVFEPAMKLFLRWARRRPRLAQATETMRAAVLKTTELYGTSGGPFTLILISFGIDPMTGRAATAAAGHGFLSGWTLAICGDMIYFTIIMASTLWLNSVLGDGRVTTITILVLMFVVPMIIQRIKKNRRGWDSNPRRL
jgi:hypothetical protein